MATHGRPVDSRYADFSRISSSQDPYSRRAEISDQDPLTATSGMEQRIPTTAGYSNRPTLASFDRDNRTDDSRYGNRQMPNNSYASYRGEYPPRSAASDGSRERYGTTPEVQTPRLRVDETPRKYTSPVEEDLRRTLYDKKYQMELQKRQAVVSGESRQMEGLDHRDIDRRLDSIRGRYGMGQGHADGIESANRDGIGSARFSPAASWTDQRQDFGKNSDPPASGRKQFTRPGADRESGRIERDQASLNERSTPRTGTNKLKEDYYYRDYHKDSESVPSTAKRVQISAATEDRQPMSARGQFQQWNERQPMIDHLPTSRVDRSGASQTAERNRQTSQRDSSSSLLSKMKEDFLRDKAKLDRQLMMNPVVSGDQTQRYDIHQRYDSGRTSDTYNTGTASVMSRSPYATTARTV